MCYYATTDYSCGDWKWGNMMLRCPRQHRIGETCGAKLVHHESVTKSSAMCKICEEISTKQRRLNKTYDNIQRWRREPDKFTASLEKAQREANELEDKVKELQSRRPSIATNMGIGSRPRGAGTNILPPVAATTASYEYQSPQASLNRRQDPNSYSHGRSGMAPASTGAGGANTAHSPYATVPASGYTGRSVSTSNAPPTNVSVSRQNVTYAARR